LSVAPSTIKIKAHKAGRLTDIGKSQRPLTELEMELYRTKRKLAEVKMERDILKKAAAYFAKESLPCTRRLTNCGFTTRCRLQGEFLISLPMDTIMAGPAVYYKIRKK
jgi:transposase-like protein